MIVLPPSLGNHLGVCLFLSKNGLGFPEGKGILDP